MENSWIDLAIVHRAKDCQVFSEAKRKVDIVRAITKNYERCSTFHEFIFIWYVCASGIPITNALIISEARREIVNEITIAISRISAAMHVGAISFLQSLTSLFWDKEQSPWEAFADSTQTNIGSYITCLDLRWNFHFAWKTFRLSLTKYPAWSLTIQ